MRTAGLDVALDAAEARQQESDFAGHQVAAVEFGRDLNRKAQAAPRLLHAIGIGNGADEIPAEADEPANLAAQNSLAGLDRVASLVPRRLETELLGQLVQRRQFRLLSDSDGSLALHVRMASYRAGTCAGLADVAAEQQQIAGHMDVLHAETMLRQSHAIDQDHGLCLSVGLGGGFDVGARKRCLGFDLGPIRGPTERRKLFKSRTYSRR